MANTDQIGKTKYHTILHLLYYYDLIAHYTIHNVNTDLTLTDVANSVTVVFSDLGLNLLRAHINHSNVGINIHLGIKTFSLSLSFLFRVVAKWPSPQPPLKILR